VRVLRSDRWQRAIDAAVGIVVAVLALAVTVWLAAALVIGTAVLVDGIGEAVRWSTD